MKKFMFLALGLLMGVLLQAQITPVATSAYGRLVDITYDPVTPSKVYALSNAGNHLLVSTDNTITWNILFSFPNTTAKLGNLKLLKGNTALSFMVNNVAYDQMGAYIYSLQTNSITNFLPIPNPEDDPGSLQNYDIYDGTGKFALMLDSYDIGPLGAQTVISKVFYTTDFGQTWSLVYLNLEHDSVMVNNVAINPQDPSKLYILRDHNPTNDPIRGGILVSQNGGTDWQEKLPGVLLNAIAFNPSNGNDILMGTWIDQTENLYRSPDGGQTWNIIPYLWSDTMGYNNIYKIAFHPTQPNNIVIVEENEIVTSTDGGNSFSGHIYSDDESEGYYSGTNVSFSPFSPQTIAFTTPYYSQLSTDGGSTLSKINAKFFNVTSVAAAKDETGTHLYYSVQGGYVHHEINSNVVQPHDVLNVYAFNSNKKSVITDKNKPGRIFTFLGSNFFGGSLDVCDDYGQTVRTLLMTFKQNMQFVTIDPNNDKIIYASLNNGLNCDLFKIDFTDIDNVINTQLTTPGINDETGNGVVTGLIVGSSDSQVLYIAQGDKFYKSEDGGLTWVEKITGLSTDNNVMLDLEVNPFDQSQFVLATFDGTFMTTDAGENWYLVNTEAIEKVAFSPLNPNIIVGSRYHTGELFYSIDNGQSWLGVTPQQLAYLQPQGVDFVFSGNSIEVYYATPDIAVVNYTIENLPLGVNNPAPNNNAVVLYPNPANDIVRVKGISNIEKIEVYGLTGQKVFTTTQNTIDSTPFQSGTYIVKILSTDGKSFTTKLIKN